MSDDEPSAEDVTPGSEDPFDRLGSDDERAGDPFDRLDDVDPDADSDRNGVGDDEPWVPPGDDRREEPVDDGRKAGSGDPFEHVDTPTESPFDDAGGVFERVDSGGVDPDQVWASITGEDGDNDGTTEPSVPDDSRYSDVSKHRFCEQCEHFSPPPDVSCGHHTAEIIEFLDMETVRLLDCPVVAEREELERGG